MSSLGNDESGYRWWHAFAPLTDKPGRLMFKLHAIYSKELANFNVKLIPDGMNKEQLTRKITAVSSRLVNFL
ncbi:MULTISPECIES: hypothetical protein [unclassified Paenibacillus]|uniref:hypothetical protein n=1 Tax=unclassified Paenibacillus TaxID=185978 RepID=UPI00362F0290